MMARHLFILSIGLGAALLVLGPATGANAELSEAERMQMVQLTITAPSVNMQIDFAADSEDVAPGSVSALHHLGEALSDVALKDTTFMVGVYADAVNDPKSQDLAERRAERIKQFLVSSYKIDADRLVTSALPASPNYPGGGLRVVNISSNKPSGGTAPEK